MLADTAALPPTLEQGIQPHAPAANLGIRREVEQVLCIAIAFLTEAKGVVGTCAWVAAGDERLAKCRQVPVYYLCRAVAVSLSLVSFMPQRRRSSEMSSDL